MDKLKSIIEGIKDGWNNIDRKKRIGIVIGLATLISLGAIFTNFSNRVDYALLFNNLELEDTGNIVSDLEAKRIKYKIEDNGRRILIDSREVDNYRIQLAMEGNLPESSTGFEIFDNIGMMVTDEDRKIMYQRALTGELQRAIMALEPVNSAKVMLVLSEKSIFETQARQASASVILDINPNTNIDENMIRGIAGLLSGAVDNLPIENIQIVDNRGNLLSGVLLEQDRVNTMDLMAQNQRIQEDFQRRIEANLMDLLGGVFGRDRIKVSVFADMDFDAQETTVIKYEDPVVRSEQIFVAGDITGQQVTGGNIDDNIANVIEGDLGEGSSYERITNNELTTETTNIIRAPGKINRMTTSIVYDGNLGEERIAQIENIVATATGFDIERGDIINVDGIVFDRTYENRLQEELDAIREAEQGQEGILETYRNYILLGLVSLLAALLIVFGIRKLLSKRKKENETDIDEELLYRALGEIEQEDKEDKEVEDVKQKIPERELQAKKFARENSDVVADLIKAWMKK